MTDEQKMDLSAESENPEGEVEVSEGSEPAVEGDAPVVEAEAESAESAESIEPDEAGEVAVAEGDSGDVDAVEAEGDDGEIKVVNDSDASEDDAEAAMLEMLEGLPTDDDKASPDDINFGAATASRAEFQHLQEPVTPPDAHNIELLMDVDLPISIELGRTRMAISDILSLGSGSVVELNKLAGEPVDLLVNNKIVARGEVVVVDENFGLRITQLLTPEERLKALARE
ncbi:MAG: flagellar motor switch protein FliN [candidate division Zixibacteria bacterium]|nr:flagellar motor switch protein FliN [candidate division Zixibacteria bacterium]